MEETRQGPRHIVNAYDQELEKLHGLIIRMGTLAAEQLGRAIQAIVDRNVDLAGEVVAADGQIDELEREVEAQTIRLLALRQPMARDLRDVVSALRISNNLERVGDFAANVAKRALALQSMPEVELARSLGPIGTLAVEMLRDIMRAYDSDDLALAESVRQRDQSLDRAYTSLFRELLTYMMEAPQRITACTHLMFAAKNMERIGDHATNVAETLIFQISGHLPEAEREKGDTSAFEVVTPGPSPVGGA